jgi:hypothetical protein
VDAQLHREWIRSRRSMGSASREKALWARFMTSKPYEEAPPAVVEDGVTSRRAASAALRRIVAGLKFIPQEPVSVGNDSFWDEMLVPPRADRLLSGVEKLVASDGGLLLGVKEPVPNDEAGDKQVSFADQDMEEFKLEWHDCRPGLSMCDCSSSSADYSSSAVASLQCLCVMQWHCLPNISRADCSSSAVALSMYDVHDCVMW